MRKSILTIAAFCLLLCSCLGLISRMRDTSVTQAADEIVAKTTKTCYWRGNISYTKDNYSPEFVESKSLGMSYKEELATECANNGMQVWAPNERYVFFCIEKSVYENMTLPTLCVKGNASGAMYTYSRGNKQAVSCGKWGMSSSGEFIFSITEYRDKDFIAVCISYDPTQEYHSGEITFTVYDASEYTGAYDGIVSASMTGFSIAQGEKKTVQAILEGVDYENVSKNLSGNMSGVQVSYASITESGAVAYLSLDVTASTTATIGNMVLPVNISGITLDVPVTVTEGTVAPSPTPQGPEQTPTPGQGDIDSTLTVPAMKAKQKGSHTTLSWQQITDVSGYVVYRSDKKDSGFEKIEVLGADAVKYVDKKSQRGKVYYYKMQAYKEKDGGYVYSEYSAVKKVLLLLKAPALKVRKSGNYIYVKWKKIGNAKGLQLCYKKSGGSYSKRLYTGKSLKKKGVRIPISSRNSIFNSRTATYCFKARIYKKSGKKKIYSAYCKEVRTK